MGERIKRQNDEGLYNPRIHSERIRELYRIKILTGIPMTVLLDTAIREFVSVYVIEPKYKFLQRNETIAEAQWRIENEDDDKLDSEPTDKMFPDPYEFEP